MHIREVPRRPRPGYLTVATPLKKCGRDWPHKCVCSCSTCTYVSCAPAARSPGAPTTFAASAGALAASPAIPNKRQHQTNALTILAEQHRHLSTLGLTCSIQAFRLEERIHTHAFQLPQVAFLQCSMLAQPCVCIQLSMACTARTRPLEATPHLWGRRQSPHAARTAEWSQTMVMCMPLQQPPAGRVLGGAPLTWVGLT